MLILSATLFRYGSIIGTLSAGDAIGAPADSIISDPNAWHHVRTSTVVASTTELEVVCISLVEFLQYIRFGVTVTDKQGDERRTNFYFDQMPAGCHEALHKVYVLMIIVVSSHRFIVCV